MFKRILIANRGEIALRIIRACKELGVEAVCVYSEADREAPYLRLADRAICIGPAPARESYLNIARLIAAAEIAEVEAIHPGYGFLAERSDFVEICREHSIEFIGPSPEAMGALGDKVEAKRFAKKAGVPIFPGSEGAIDDEDEAAKIAEETGYPVILKAAAGGGGRGMRVCRNEKELRSNIKQAQNEALAAFGNGSVFIEKFLENARHVEVQVIGDKHGNSIHLWERDCSMQRRHQKIIEEAPGPGIDRKRVQEVCEAAARLVRSAEYSGAATVEFLMDKDQNFYMLEVNTRVQVEHPVTEMITGLDIVQLSILVAAGEPIPFKQEDVKVRGHAIECRINAEDPDKNFMPCAGRINTWIPPGGPGVRVDSHACSGYTVPPNYDSMVGKLIVHADTRDKALNRMARALGEFTVEPIKTTIPLHLRLMQDEGFRKGGVDIHYLERLLKG
ncbi:MAG: acetyl-CoA carboxylase biotin carboxylase subunit [Phycisphaerales bacterium]|nr:MAG: acetyl-CoA carboxylase biotin carboxylase subunit [Phycisphaerales bacterium]